MNRKALALAVAALLAIVMTACSSSDNAKKVDGGKSTTTTEEESTTTTEEETTTTTGSGLKPKINLGGLGAGSGTSSEITTDDETCVSNGVADDPILWTYDSFEELQDGPQSDLEAFYNIFIDCVGMGTAVDLFMQGFSSAGSLSDDTVACARLVVEGLTQNEMAMLLAGDQTVTADLTSTITTLCI